MKEKSSGLTGGLFSICFLLWIRLYRGETELAVQRGYGRSKAYMQESMTSPQMYTLRRRMPSSVNPAFSSTRREEALWA